MPSRTCCEGPKGWGRSQMSCRGAEIVIAEKSEHPPLAIAKRITTHLVEARDKGLISDITLASFDQILQLLIDYLGGCERIALDAASVCLHGAPAAGHDRLLLYSAVCAG